MTLAAALLVYRFDPPYRGGHMRRRHGCVRCGRPTRRTVLVVDGLEPWARTRYVLHRECERPTPEERLLMAVFNAETLLELERKAGR